jgi:hypothetical protein
MKDSSRMSQERYPYSLLLLDRADVLLQLWVCGDGTLAKFGGDVESYKVSGCVSS